MLIATEISINKPKKRHMETIDFTDFTKINIRVGEIIEAVDNTKAINPSYILTIDFGKEIGIKKSSAQLTENYTKEGLVHKKILAVVNFPPKRIARIKSEVLVLAVICKKNGTVLIEPNKDVENGMRVL